jgi:hypothetical protein
MMVAIQRRLGAAGAIALSLGLTAMLPARAAWAAASVDVRGALLATAAGPGASGSFRQRSTSGTATARQTRGTRTRLVVKVKNLHPSTRYDVRLSSMPVGTLDTNAAGGGRAVFSSSPSGRAQALAVDPRGRVLTVGEANGDDMLEGEVSDPTTPGGIQCCLDTTDQQGCDSLLPADCAAAGGVDMGPGSCEPDPCAQQGGNPDEDGAADGEVNGGTTDPDDGGVEN